MRRTAAHALVAVAVTPLAAVGSEETLLEEIVVTASFVGVNESSATRPIHVLDGATVTEAGVQSLGEWQQALSTLRVDVDAVKDYARVRARMALEVGRMQRSVR